MNRDELLERPPDPQNESPGLAAKGAREAVLQGNANSTADNGAAQAPALVDWRSGLPAALIDLVTSWRAALPREPLPVVVQLELARYWSRGDATLGGEVKTIPAQFFSAATAGDRDREIAQALYDVLGAAAAAKLSAALVDEVQHRDASALRGKQLLDSLFDSP